MLSVSPVSLVLGYVLVNTCLEFAILLEPDTSKFSKSSVSASVYAVVPISNLPLPKFSLVAGVSPAPFFA